MMSQPHPNPVGPRKKRFESLSNNNEGELQQLGGKGFADRHHTVAAVQMDDDAIFLFAHRLNVMLID